jgi:hypothetical protein
MTEPRFYLGDCPECRTPIWDTSAAVYAGRTSCPSCDWSGWPDVDDELDADDPTE